MIESQPRRLSRWEMHTRHYLPEAEARLEQFRQTRQGIVLWVDQFSPESPIDCFDRLSLIEREVILNRIINMCGISYPLKVVLPRGKMYGPDNMAAETERICNSGPNRPSTVEKIFGLLGTKQSLRDSEAIGRQRLTELYGIDFSRDKNVPFYLIGSEGILGLLQTNHTSVKADDVLTEISAAIYPATEETARGLGISLQ